VYSDTYQRTYILLNDGKDKDKPTFTQKLFFNMEKRNHAMHAGGGDWNGDGVIDFMHMPFGGGSYKLFKGTKHGKTGVKYSEGGLKSSERLRFKADKENKARKCAWAWDFSGTAKKRGVIEYVGIDKPGNINFYEISNDQSKKVGLVFKPEGRTPLLTVSDLNNDGKMDIVYSQGLWNNQRDKTKIFVMYGKVSNIPGKAKSEEEPKPKEKKTSRKYRK
jgi:hypothetical protein